MSFWCVAKVRNKKEGFWRVLGKWIVVMLSETWVKGKEWKAVKRILPRNFRWVMDEEERERRKRRSAGEIISGMRKVIKGGNLE